MAFTDKSQIPDDSVLNVEEIPLSTGAMKAAGPYIAQACLLECQEYMLCLKEEDSHVTCIPRANKVTSCGMQFLRELKVSPCYQEFENFAMCLDRSPMSSVVDCGKAFKTFTNCMEKADIKRVPFGKLSRPQIYEGDMPKPPPPFKEFPHKVVPPLPKAPEKNIRIREWNDADLYRDTKYHGEKF